MKGILRKLAAVILTITCMSGMLTLDTYADNSSFYAQHGALSVSGNKLVDKNGTPVQLHGVSTFNIAWYPQYFSRNTYASLRDEWGVNAVRLVVYTQEYNGYCTVGEAKRKEYRDSIVQGVKDLYDLGMYAIVDWHILSDGNPNTHKGEALAFFSEMSKRLSSYNNVIYEVCNEPNNGTDWNTIRSYAVDAVNTIRANAPSAVIVIGTPTWSQDVDAVIANPVKAGNIMYTLHFYAGTHKQWLRDKAQSAINAGLALMVTEFGVCNASGNGNFDAAEGNRWISFLNQNNISFFIWNLSNKNETSALIRPDCSLTSGWSYAQLSQNGQWYYNTLKQYQTGLIKDADGVYRYKVNGATATDYNSLILYNGAWYYIQNGVLNWNYTSLVQYNGGWFYVENGTINWNYTGLVQYNGGWFYVENGTINWNYTGLVQYKEGWFYVENGMINWNYTGLAQNNVGWFYVENGMINWGYTGLAQNNVGWFYVENGMINWGYTGLVQNNVGWFYVENGMINWNYTGQAEYQGNIYNIVGGILS